MDRGWQWFGWDVPALERVQSEASVVQAFLEAFEEDFVALWKQLMVPSSRWKAAMSTRQSLAFRLRTTLQDGSVDAEGNFDVQNCCREILSNVWKLAHLWLAPCWNGQALTLMNQQYLQRANIENQQTQQSKKSLQKNQQTQKIKKKKNYRPKHFKNELDQKHRQSTACSSVTFSSRPWASAFPCHEPEEPLSPSLFGVVV